MSIQLFDAVRFPFSGIRLIEASAGTGKTYSLSNLYIRLITGHGSEHNSQFERALAVDEILVLTFTRAATRELKKRIYQRIQETLEFFANHSRSGEDHTPENHIDPFLQQLYDELDNLDEAVMRLRYAATLIDQASIFTLHSFCQKIVQDNSFSLQYNLQATFEIESYNHAKNILLDIWRELNHLDQPKHVSTLIHSLWSNFDNFCTYFINFLTTHQDTPISNPVVTTSETFDAIFETRYYQNVLAFKHRWLSELEEIEAFFQQEAIIRSHLYVGRINKLTKLCRNDFEYFTNLKNKDQELLSWFSSSTIKQQTRKNFDIPNIPSIYFIVDDLLQQLPRSDDIKLKQWIVLASRERWHKYKEQQQIIFPDDVLQQIIKALETPESMLINKLREKFPVALIDEFQDTAAAQYTIFKRLYGSSTKATPSASGSTKTALVLIGDPKQAIYQFRGADLYTYINAKQNIANSQHYHMQNNWRSSSALVSACNTLFTHAKNPFLNEKIPYIAVQAKAHTLKQKPLLGIAHEQHQQHINFHFWYVQDSSTGNNQAAKKQPEFEPHINAGLAKQVLFEQCAKTLVSFLKSPGHTVNNRAINSRDICILVRTRNDARTIKQLLFEYGIASVFLTKDSVYASECAQQLSYLLDAILRPQQITKIKTALSTHFYQVTQNELAQREAEEDFWQSLQHNFTAYREHWQRYGVLSMLQLWALENNVYTKLKSLATGLRWISDFQHIAQLLEEASHEHATLESIYNYLNHHISLSQKNTTAENDEYTLRLENDDSLISISTVHTSKGLEYPIVFYPYACGGSSNTSPIIQQQDTQGNYYQTISFSTDDQTQRMQISDSLAEDIRLLYVALTRAKYACYVGFANTGNAGGALAFKRSALAHILNLATAAKLERGEVYNLLAALNMQNPHISFSILDAYEQQHESDIKPQTPQVHAVEQQLLDDDKNPAHLIPAHSPPIIKHNWSVSSYSLLAHHREAQQEHQGKDEFWEFNAHKPQQVALIEPESQPVDNVMSQTHQLRFNFPKGPHIGQFLHSVLEQAAFAELHLNSKNSSIDSSAYNNLAQLIDKQLKYFSLEHLSASYLDCLCAWIIDIANQRLIHTKPSQAFSLASLCLEQQQKIKVEMQFYFAVKTTTNTQQISQLLGKYGYLDAGGKPLEFRMLHGLLTGYIDVIVEHHNQYYIIDYKSNDLGQDLRSYDQKSMQTAITEHHYDLQYILYTLAVHRILKFHIGDYDYNKHIGGCIYMFLRGISHDAASSTTAKTSHATSGVFFDKPPAALIHALDKLFVDE